MGPPMHKPASRQCRSAGLEPVQKKGRLPHLVALQCVEGAGVRGPLIRVIKQFRESHLFCLHFKNR